MSRFTFALAACALLTACPETDPTDTDLGTETETETETET
ncbi:MAG: hypothetical protein ACI9MC_002132, partial [Kiritimatiellia bacterium]